MPTMFSEDSADLGGAGFHINTTSHWVVSHVGSDPFKKSSGIVNTSDILETNMLELYKTTRTSTSSLRYYVDQNIRKDFDINKEAGSHDRKINPPQAPSSDSARQDEKRRGVIVGIAALCIAAAVISSSVVYLWLKWVSLVKRQMA
uniref:Uncharacterized protein n=1 Tax=Setaria italica TaxID=4555 RepID=K3YYH6_SETIT